LLAESKTKLCFTCHKGMLDEVKGGVVHGLFGRGECLECHNAHASSNPDQLIKGGSEGCIECHSDIWQKSSESKYKHTPFVEEPCVVCHNPHGSKISGQLNRPAGPLCLSCHETVADGLKNQKHPHSPALEGNCLVCHAAHSGERGKLLVAEGGGLCKECHDPNQQLVQNSHKGVSLVNADCSGCHEPHSSDSKGLLHKVMHEPFMNKQCQLCHEQ
ncbi:MAG: cytochrome c3 family protein, partial [Pseudomonadota bacterium]